VEFGGETQGDESNSDFRKVNQSRFVKCLANLVLIEYPDPDDDNVNYTWLLIGGTIAEDVLTGGGGIVDDPATLGLGGGMVCKAFGW